MAKVKKTKKKPTPKESDATYILKLVMYMIVGSLWIKISTSDSNQIPLPVGFVIGVLFATHDHFKIDRKIEYALLLVAMLIGFWLPIGLYINL